MKKILPILSIIFAGIFWGCLSLFLRPLQSYGLDGMQTATIKVVFATIIYFFIILFYNPKLFKINLKDIWIFIFIGIICISLFSFLYFQTVIMSEVAVAVVLLYTSPIFVLICSAFIFKEKITVLKIVASIITVVGCIFVSGVINGTAIITPMVLLTGLLSGLIFGLHNIFVRIAGTRNYNGLTINFYAFFIGMIFILPFGKVSDTICVFKENPIAILWGIGLALINAVLAYFLFSTGLRYIPSSTASILVATEPMVGSILGMCVFHESHDIFKILGVVFIVISIVLMNIKWRNNEKFQS